MNSPKTDRNRLVGDFCLFVNDLLSVFVIIYD